MSAGTTRRAMLGAAIAAPALAVPGIASGAQPIPSVRPCFARKLARFRRLEAAREAHDDTVCVSAREGYLALVEQLPHTSADAGESITGGRVILTTEKSYQVDMARSARTRPFSDEKYQAALEKIADAADARDAEIEKAAVESGLRGAIEYNDRLGDVVANAEWRFIQTPVTNGAELELKLALIEERDAQTVLDAVNAIIADARALAERAA